MTVVLPGIGRGGGTKGTYFRSLGNTYNQMNNMMSVFGLNEKNFLSIS